MAEETTGANGAGADAGGTPRNDDNITTHNWDGWPTTPTPNYLIPEMGRVPISSTFHFQTVAMTELGEEVPADELWMKLRAPLLRHHRNMALQGIAKLTITKAVFGDLASMATIDVPRQLRDMIDQRQLFIEKVEPQIFGAATSAAQQILTVDYSYGELEEVHFKAEIANGETLWIPPQELNVKRARYGDFKTDRTVDVTALVREQVVNRSLEISVPHEFFEDPAPGAVKRLVVEVTLEEIGLTLSAYDNEVLRVPRDLQINRANYGAKPGKTADVTEKLSSLIRNNRLSLVASDEFLGVDTGSAPGKRLFVEFLAGGAANVVEILENDNWSVGDEIEMPTVTAG